MERWRDRGRKNRWTGREIAGKTNGSARNRLLDFFCWTSFVQFPNCEEFQFALMS